MPQSLRITTAAACEAVSLTEAKLHAKVDGTTDDTLLTSLVKAAGADAAAELGRGAVLVEATFELTLDAFPAGDEAIVLPTRPATAMVSFKYDDADGTEQTLASNAYVFTASATGPGESPVLASLRPLKGETWPATEDDYGAVRIRYKAGWATAGSPATSTTPEQIKTWILVKVATLYGQRESLVDDRTAAIPDRTFDCLLDPWRILEVG